MNSFILVDCNNFYVSCERLFNPRLEGKPVIVLSNNDGCVIARSQEAKEIGIGMGEPFFKIKELCKVRGVYVYSSNYRLYGDLSRRVMTILSEMAPEIQIYSIDEAFLKYPFFMEDDQLLKSSMEIRHFIKKWVGIPVSLGIGPTKTLAKIASKLAKKNRDLGVFNLNHPDIRHRILQDFPVGEIWGIGKNLQARLRGMGINTAEDFYTADPAMIRKRMGVIGERMLWELRGTSCLDLEEVAPKKSITCSRSFGQVITDAVDLAEALSAFIHTACVKLRKQRSFAQALLVYLEALIEPGQPLRSQLCTTVSFPYPTHDTSQIIAAAKQCLKKLYLPNNRYKKCGIILQDLLAETHVVPDLFSEGLHPMRTQVMRTMDEINQRMGKNAIFLAAMGTHPKWKMRRERLSAHNLSCWEQLPLVNANFYFK